MRARIWGSRGSLATPGPETVRYGGNTACIEVALSDGSLVILDAGTGIRGLGLSLDGYRPARIDI
ncbi:MAG TPA: MBL fold metallo-hydrolase, partial [Actinomycetota bacterium]